MHNINKVTGGKKFDAIEAAVSIDPDALTGKLVAIRYQHDENGENPTRLGDRQEFVLDRAEIETLMTDQDACTAKAAELLGVTLADAPKVSTKKSKKGKS